MSDHRYAYQLDCSIRIIPRTGTLNKTIEQMLFQKAAAIESSPNCLKNWDPAFQAVDKGAFSGNVPADILAIAQTSAWVAGHAQGRD
jgi:hypothetical protein